MGHNDKESAGYRTLNSFTTANIIHLGITGFCKRFVSTEDSPSEIAGHMVCASRAAKQSIARGAAAAKGGLTDLLCDLEDYLAVRGEIPWSIHADDYKAISRIQMETFESTDDLLHDYSSFLAAEKLKFDPWLQSENPIIVANALILLVQKGIAQLERERPEREERYPKRDSFRDRRPPARPGSRDSRPRRDNRDGYRRPDQRDSQSRFGGRDRPRPPRRDDR